MKSVLYKGRKTFSSPVYGVHSLRIEALRNIINKYFNVKRSYLVAAT